MLTTHLLKQYHIHYASATVKIFAYNPKMAHIVYADKSEMATMIDFFQFP